MELSNKFSNDGGGGFGLDLSIGAGSLDDLDTSSMGSISLGRDLGLSEFGGPLEMLDFPTLPDLGGLDPVAQGEALRSLDGTTGSRDATDKLLSASASPEIDVAAATSAVAAATGQADIVVTADPTLTHLVSPEIMSEPTFALFERDDNALREHRDDVFANTGVDYDILQQERHMASEYLFMGEFAQLREQVPANFYAGDRPEPGGLEDIAGKVWAAPVTAIGSVAGAANVGLGALAGNENAEIQFGDNGIQFVGGAVGQGGTLGWGGNGALTLGNAQLYAGTVTPDSRDTGYDSSQQPGRVGDHEEGHTYQYQRDGVTFFTEYLPQGLQNGANPYEQAADAGARGASPYPSDPASPSR